MKPYGDNYAELYVHRDIMQPKVWRLAWMVPGSDCYVHDTGECDTAGRFRTRREAVWHGKAHYNETAKSF